MKPIDRQAQIIHILRNEGRVSVESLVAQLGTSPETIRRDLTVLSSSGKLQKVHGGAISPQIMGEGPFQQRMGENIKAKRIIAEKACELISSGDTLFIDTGSTTLTFAESLVAIENLTIVTNSSDIAKTVSEQTTTEVYLVGGLYNRGNRETIGAIAVNQIQQFHLNHAVLTAGAIDCNAGITDFNIDEAQLAKAMIKQSDNIIILSDSSKLNRIAPFKVATLDEVDHLISESQPSNPLQIALTNAGVQPFFEKSVKE
ncbi:MAG: DeoR/GlpR family DNA-binding transcription regulator [Cocleimonas sp.]